MKGLFFYTIVICLFIPQTATAGFLDSIQHIDEVVVTLQLTGEIAPSQKICSEKMRNIGTASVADALKNFAGVQIKDYGGIGGVKTINIRSMGTNHTAIFYDGVQLGNAMNGQTDLGKLSVENVSEIALYNGQRSNIFQPAKDFASSGAVYISTEAPSFQTGKKQFIKAGFNTAVYQLTNNKLSYGLTNPYLVFNQKLSNKTSLSTNAEFVNSDGKYLANFSKVNAGKVYDTSFIRTNGDITSLRFESGLYGTINNGDWRAKAYVYYSDRGLPGAIIKRATIGEGARLTDRNIFIQSYLQKHFGRYDMKLTAKISNDYTHYVSNDSVKTIEGDYSKNNRFDNTYKQNELYVSSANKYSVLPFLDLALSADFVYNTMDADLKDFVYSHRYTELLALATEARFSKLVIQANVTGNFIQDKTTALQTTSEFMPAIITSYKINNNLSLRAFYKNSFRMPTMNELYYTYYSSTKSILKPEYTRQYNLGAAYSVSFNTFIQNLSISGDIYHNRINDKITAFFSGDLFRWTMMNIGKVSITGTDINVQSHLKPSKNTLVHVRANYTYQKALDITDAASDYYKSQIGYVPLHSGSASLTVGFYGYMVGLSSLYTGEKVNEQNESLKQWLTNDISFAKTLKTGSANIRLSANINNVFNQYYDIVKNYPMPGRNYRLGISVEF